MSNVSGFGAGDTAGSVEPAVDGPAALPDMADVLRVAESGFVTGRRLPGGREENVERLLAPEPVGAMEAEVLAPLDKELLLVEMTDPEIDSEPDADALMPDCKELIADRSELTSSEPVDETDATEREVPDCKELVAICDELESDTLAETLPVD